MWSILISSHAHLCTCWCLTPRTSSLALRHIIEFFLKLRCNSKAAQSTGHTSPCHPSCLFTMGEISIDSYVLLIKIKISEVLSSIGLLGLQFAQKHRWNFYFCWTYLSYILFLINFDKSPLPSKGLVFFALLFGFHLSRYDPQNVYTKAPFLENSPISSFHSRLRIQKKGKKKVFGHLWECFQTKERRAKTPILRL